MLLGGGRRVMGKEDEEGPSQSNLEDTVELTMFRLRRGPERRWRICTTLPLTEMSMVMLPECSCRGLWSLTRLISKLGSYLRAPIGILPFH